MTPPKRIPPPSGPVQDPVADDGEAPPSEEPTEAAPPPPQAAPSQGPRRVVPAVSPQAGPAVSSPSAAPGPDPFPAKPSKFWQRLHLVVGGGYSLKTRVYGDAEPFNSAAASHHGGILIFQPSYSVLRSRWLDLNLGLDLRHRILSVPQSPGAVSSDISATSVGALAEGNLFIIPNFGIGAAFLLNYMGLSSSNADVGAPFSASLNFDGNIAVGAQFFLHTWNGAIRLGASIDKMIGGFSLKTSTGNPDLLVSMDPTWSIFLGVDAFQMIRNLQGTGDRPK